MPLYKRKHNFSNTQSNSQSLKENFKKPLPINNIKINETEEFIKEKDINKLENRQKCRFAKTASAEYCLQLTPNENYISPNSQHEESEKTINKKQQKKKKEKLTKEEKLVTNDEKKKQPKRKDYLNSNQPPKKSKKEKLTDEDTEESQVNSSIRSLWSQAEIPSNEPPEHLSHYERLLWLQEQRNTGLYVLCDKCDKFRYLKDTQDPLDLPELWYCHMNPDKNHNSCSDPEVEIAAWVEDDLINNLYNAGSIVWAKLDGFPWWPAMIDDCPDTEMYYWLDNEYTDVPTSYNVTFFDSQTVSRAWLKPDAIRKFKGNEKNLEFKLPKSYRFFKSRIDFAIGQAKNALTLPLPKRLDLYSFLARWPGKINPPIDVKEEHKTKIKHSKNKKVKSTHEGKSKNNIKSPDKETSVKNKRGRPPKVIQHDEDDRTRICLSPNLIDGKKKRGRPAKINRHDEDDRTKKCLSPDLFDGADTILDEIVKSLDYDEIDVDQFVKV